MSASETLMVEEVPFPLHITATNNPLSLLGHGVTDIEIHFLHIKLTAIGVYLDPDVVTTHLQQWKGKGESELAENDGFFEALVSVPTDVVIRVVVIKEIKGSQFGVQLESAVRDRLAAVDQYEEEEEEALEKVIQFFQSSNYLKKHSLITFTFPATASLVEITLTSTTEGKEESKNLRVENENVAKMMKKWYLDGPNGVSRTTTVSLAHNLVALLSN
ncbi:hypothetical protein Sjap_014336 [Stephania japonica]|uniref:Chalcone-flavonone isomerase family protein n=1 Tax=Stephania japonica TaxID=461633 RepID=A0AAP0NZW4_9MAGN